MVIPYYNYLGLRRKRSVLNMFPHDLPSGPDDGYACVHEDEQLCAYD